MYPKHTKTWSFGKSAVKIRRAKNPPRKSVGCFRRLQAAGALSVMCRVAGVVDETTSNLRCSQNYSLHGRWPMTHF
eukprot:2310654-Amphidinium_carterae.1